MYIIYIYTYDYVYYNIYDNVYTLLMMVTGHGHATKTPRQLQGL